jgi:hypothetical protein
MRSCYPAIPLSQPSGTQIRRPLSEILQLREGLTHFDNINHLRTFGQAGHPSAPPRSTRAGFPHYGSSSALDSTRDGRQRHASPSDARACGGAFRRWHQLMRAQLLLVSLAMLGRSPKLRVGRARVLSRASAGRLGRAETDRRQAGKVARPTSAFINRLTRSV